MSGCAFTAPLKNRLLDLPAVVSGNFLISDAVVTFSSNPFCGAVSVPAVVLYFIETTGDFTRIQGVPRGLLPVCGMGMDILGRRRDKGAPELTIVAIED
jgi:hypothetical protein